MIFMVILNVFANVYKATHFTFLVIMLLNDYLLQSTHRLVPGLAKDASWGSGSRIVRQS